MKRFPLFCHSERSEEPRNTFVRPFASLRVTASVLAVLFWTCLVMGQEQKVVIQKGVVRRNFAVTGFTGDPSVGAQVADVLKNDLKLSGHFTIVPSAQAEFIQQGSVRIEGKNGVIECAVTLSATKQVVLSRAYQGSAQDIRRMVHRLTDDIVATITGQKGIAQSQIAFVLERGAGVKELAVMDYDGHNARQRTFDRTLSLHPRWSPDGRKIVYMSYLHRFPDVLEVNLYTGARRKLAAWPGLNSGAAYAPDGKTVALTLSKDGNPELYLMNANGGGLRRLTNTKGGESSPCWTPDGQNVTFVSDDGGSAQIYSISREGGAPVKLATAPSYNTEPAWSWPPAGSPLSPMLGVTSRVGGKFQIGLWDSATREVRTLVADNGDNEDPSWGPDGRHLVFTKTRGYRPRLYLLDVLTGEQVELPAVEGGASEPAWGP